MSNGKSYTCVNHPNYRWFTTKPGGKLTFAGELPTEEHPTGRPDYPAPPAIKHLKARMEGVNPFCTDLKDPDGPSIKTWADVLEFVAYIEDLHKRWVIECDCPAGPETFIEVDEDANEYLRVIRLPEETPINQ